MLLGELLVQEVPDLKYVLATSDLATPSPQHKFFTWMQGVFKVPPLPF